MKKILTVSLMAMMVVGAARADIASVGYVDEKLATKANVSDVTSISNKLGTVAEGKTVVDLIEAAKQDAIAGVASYDDTEVRGLIGDNAEAISELESKVGNSSVADQIDAVRATTIAGLTEEQQQTMFPTVDLTGQMIATSTNDFATSIGDNATAIQNINNSAVMKSGITEGKVAAYDAYAEAISDNAAAAEAAQDAAEAAQGAAATAKTEAIAAAQSYADGLAKNYDAAGSAAQALTDAKAYADGLGSNYDAKGAAAAAETAAIAAAKTAGDAAYDAKGSATQALTDAKDYADGVAATAKSEAIAAAKSAGDAAYDAKGAAEAAKTAAVAAAKEAADAAYAAKAYETRVQANETAIAANKTATETNAASIAAMAQAGIKAEGAGDGTYALTMKVTDGVRTFQWDQIGY